MTDFGDTLIDAITTAIPDSTSAQIRYAGDNTTLDGTISTAICTGIEESNLATEQGMYAGKAGIVRYKQSDEPSAWFADQQPVIIGELVEVLLPGETDNWTKCRVANRLAQSGMIRLDVEAPYQE